MKIPEPLKAYCNFIMANFEFEQQLWKACLTKFEACQKIYQSLSETLPGTVQNHYPRCRYFTVAIMKKCVFEPF